MKIIPLSVCIWLCFAPVFHTQDKQGWQGIIPLRSTRADVERLLGRSADSCQCIYRTEHEIVSVEYARRSCKDDPQGWNVPVDTVLQISVVPKGELRLTDLKIDMTTYKRTEDTELPGRYYYFSGEEGILIIALKDGLVGSVSFQPTKDDNNLRCPKCN